MASGAPIIDEPMPFSCTRDQNPTKASALPTNAPDTYPLALHLAGELNTIIETY
jgi:hypothetical protein